MKRRLNQGLSYPGILVFVAVLGFLSSRVAELVSTSQQRDDEVELLFIGQQFVAALQSYYFAAPADTHHLPAKLENLLSDPRYSGTLRHWRRIPHDPITRSRQWGLILDHDGGIRGIHSLSARQPLKRASFPTAFSHFEDAAHYHEWIFEFTPDRLPPPETPHP